VRVAVIHNSIPFGCNLMLKEYHASWLKNTSIMPLSRKYLEGVIPGSRLDHCIIWLLCPWLCKSLRFGLSEITIKTVDVNAQLRELLARVRAFSEPKNQTTWLKWSASWRYLVSWRQCCCAKYTRRENKPIVYVHNSQIWLASFPKLWTGENSWLSYTFETFILT
jgi:hypothetical protein